MIRGAAFRRYLRIAHGLCTPQSNTSPESRPYAIGKTCSWTAAIVERDLSAYRDSRKKPQ